LQKKQEGATKYEKILPFFVFCRKGSQRVGRWSSLLKIPKAWGSAAENAAVFICALSDLNRNNLDLCLKSSKPYGIIKVETKSFACFHF
jgi:hypothetical protein